MKILDQLKNKAQAAHPENADLWAASDFIKDLICIRLRKKLTQREVADRMGLPQSRVSDIESRGERASLIRIIAYARALGVEIVPRKASNGSASSTPKLVVKTSSDSSTSGGSRRAYEASMPLAAKNRE
jgi:transcriptional regulator with XRE-family HTH domain